MGEDLAHEKAQIADLKEGLSNIGDSEVTRFEFFAVLGPKIAATKPMRQTEQEKLDGIVQSHLQSLEPILTDVAHTALGYATDLRQYGYGVEATREGLAVSFRITGVTEGFQSLVLSADKMNGIISMDIFCGVDTEDSGRLMESLGRNLCTLWQSALYEFHLQKFIETVLDDNGHI